MKLIMVLASMIMGAIILTLIVMIQVKDRDYEIGILLSIGESNIKIILQMIIEVLTPILLGAAIAVYISSLFVNKLTDFLGGRDKIDVSLQFGPIFYMFLCGIILTLVASISMIRKILCYHPKDMLKEIQ